MKKYAEHVAPTPTPQTSPIPGREQDMQKNAAGGYGFNLDDVRQLRRFLCLGAEGGTHYQDEEELTRENVEAVKRLFDQNPAAVVPTILDVRKNKWALKQSPAIFALALAIRNQGTRKAALSILNDVCRTASQLFELLGYMRQLGGKLKINKSIRRAVSNWYTSKDPSQLTYQIVKYRNRSGFTHGDVLDLIHVRPLDNEQEQLFAWVSRQYMASSAAFTYAVARMKDERKKAAAIARREQTIRLSDAAVRTNGYIAGFEALQTASVSETAALVRAHGFTREMVPTQMLNETVVWEALLEKMPYEAMLRSLGKVSSMNMIKLFGENTWIDRITNPEIIKRSDVHPMRILTALKQYQVGHGDKGSLSWTPDGKILQALETAFYTSFDNVEPLDKNVMVWVDVSGSMTDKSVVGINNMYPWEAAAAFALVYMKANPNVRVAAFDTEATLLPQIHAGMTIAQVTSVFAALGHGYTDCSIPFRYIKENRLPVDGVLMLTDSETWAGHEHVVEANTNNIKFFNIQLTSSRASLNDPTEKNWYEVNGFSADTVQVANLFFRGII